VTTAALDVGPLGRSTYADSKSVMAILPLFESEKSHDEATGGTGMADGGTLTDLGVLLPGREARNGHYNPANSPGHGLVFDRDKLPANTVARVPATDALMADAR
jgi:hypothetical protein